MIGNVKNVWMLINWNVSCWIFLVTDNRPAVSPVRARPRTLHKCGNCPIGDWRWGTRMTGPGFSRSHWSCCWNTHPVLRPATLAAPQNERMRPEWRERESSHQGGRRGVTSPSWAGNGRSSQWRVSLCMQQALSSQPVQFAPRGTPAHCRAPVLHDSAASTLQWETEKLCLHWQWMTAEQRSPTESFIAPQEKWIFWIGKTIDYSPASFCIGRVSQYLV